MYIEVAISNAHTYPPAACISNFKCSISNSISNSVLFTLHLK